MPDEHTQVVLNDIQRALIERQQRETVEIMAFYGGQQGWFDSCRRRNFSNRDRQLARVVVHLLSAAGDPGPLRCHPADLARLATDAPLTAFWKSVAAAGRDGRREERQRVKGVATEAARSGEPEERLLALDVNAVMSLMPTYRTWGRLLLGGEGRRLLLNTEQREHHNTAMVESTKSRAAHLKGFLRVRFELVYARPRRLVSNMTEAA